MTPEEDYNQYMQLHRNFSETYTMVYRHVMDFYPLPQKFIQEAAPKVDSYVEDFWTHKNAPPENSSFRELVFFAQSFKQFATEANNVFEEYKGLHGQSNKYMKAIFSLKQNTNAGADEYAKLIPVLNKLITGFEDVKQKTEKAAKKLQKLQMEWTSLKEKMSSNKL
jgi:regulator of replication initiation timing